MILIGIVLLVVTALVYVTGLTIADIEDIRRVRDIRRHPFAARRRARPTIAVRIRGNPEHVNLKHVGYRKLVFADHSTCNYALEHDSQAHLPHGSLHHAVFVLQGSPRLTSVAVTHTPSSPTTLRSLLACYREFVGALSDKSRRGLGLGPRRIAWVRLVHLQPATSTLRRIWQLIYSIAAHLALLFMSYTFIYSLFIAITTHQTSVLLVSIVGFVGFIGYAILSTPYLSYSDKASYLLLLPVSIPYLVLQPWWRCLAAVGRVGRIQYQRRRLALRTISGA